MLHYVGFRIVFKWSLNGGTSNVLHSKIPDSVIRKFIIITVTRLTDLHMLLHSHHSSTHGRLPANYR